MSAPSASVQPATPNGAGAPSDRPSALTLWWLAARPKTLTAAASPIFVAAGCAAYLGGFHWQRALLCLLGAILLQVAANFANDVFDFEKGADTASRVGPLRVVQAGWVTPREMRRALWLVLALATAVGVWLATLGGPVIALVGVAGLVSAVAYTGGPYPLGYHGLGDLFVFLFFGLAAVVGTVFLQTATAPALAWAAAVPAGSLSTAILVVNNLRDAPQDGLVGKRTLVVRFGRRFGVAQFATLLAMAYAVPAALAFVSSGPGLALPLLSAPLAWPLLQRVRRLQGSALNPCLAATARLLLLHSALFGVGLWLSA